MDEKTVTPPVTPEPLSAEELDAISKRPELQRRDTLTWEWRRRGVVEVTLRERDRLIAQARAASPSPWQPIATAPKDGTWIVVLAHALRDHHPVAVRWSQDVGDGESFSWNDGMDTIVGGPLSWQPIAQPLPAPPGSGGRRP